MYVSCYVCSLDVCLLLRPFARCMSLTAPVHCRTQGTLRGSRFTALFESECTNNRMQSETKCVLRPLVVPSAAWCIYSRTELDIKTANVARVCRNTAKGTDLCAKKDKVFFHLALWKLVSFPFLTDIFGAFYFFLWSSFDSVVSRSDYIPGVVTRAACARHWCGWPSLPVKWYSGSVDTHQADGDRRFKRHSEEMGLTTNWM